MAGLTIGCRCRAVIKMNNVPVVGHMAVITGITGSKVSRVFTGGVITTVTENTGIGHAGVIKLRRYPCRG